MTADVIAFPRGGREGTPRHRGDVRRPRRSAADRVVSAVLTLALLAGAVAFLALGIGPRVLGYRTATMLTGSMTGTIDAGDVIVSVPKPADEVEVGDILTFHAPVPDQHVETHRVIEVGQAADGRTTIRTQGDANAEPDPWRATIQGDTVWETVRVIPGIGNAIRALRAPVVRHGVLWVALGALVVLGSSLIWRHHDEETAPAPEPAPEALDDAALGRLAEDLEDAAFAATFAARYQELLPQRLDRISTALGSAARTPDLGAALDASLSLKVSSTTVGARELEQLATVIELSVRRHDVEAARALTEDLAQAARRADRALATYLERRAG